MKIDTQKTEQLQALSELLQPMKFAMLTTQNSQGQLSSCPMTILKMDSTGALWCFTDLQAERTLSLSSINLSFTEHDHATFVSISARGEIVTDRTLIEDLWTPAAKPWFPQGKESPNLALLKIVPSVAQYWDSPHSKVIRIFALAISVITRNPVGLGDHHTLTSLSTE
jgi:general stress protein 26